MERIDDGEKQNAQIKEITKSRNVHNKEHMTVVKLSWSNRVCSKESC